MELNRFLLLSVGLLALAASVCNADERRSEENEGSSRLELVINSLKNTYNQARNYLGKQLQTVNNQFGRVRSGAFDLFASVYNKTYSPFEFPFREAIFMQRRREIVESQKAYDEGLTPFALRENEFTDFNETELQKMSGGSLMPKEEQLIEEDDDEEPIVCDSKSCARDDDYDDLPASVDWRKSGCISEVIAQSDCGACYAITSVGVVESMRCIRGKKPLVQLSVQQVVDCSRDLEFTKNGYHNDGCNSGWPTPTLQYLQQEGVLASEACYPFEKKVGDCRINELKSGRKSSKCLVSPSSTDDAKLQYKVLRSEREIKYHIAKTGPVVSLIQVNEKFRYFGKGIFDDTDKECSNKRSDRTHAITIVGYGRERNTDYWIIKNSWGKNWGDKGYAKYRRGSNVCSIGFYGWAVVG